MSWKRLTRLLGGNTADPAADAPPGDVPEVRWVEATDNSWCVRLLDVRPVTLGMLATTTDAECATNAISFRGDDGAGFIGVAPPVPRTVSAQVRYPIDRILADGVLFAPDEMEQKWAIFHHGGQIIFVRSWLRQVQVVADVETHDDQAIVTTIRGVFNAGDDSPEFTTRVLDFLIRSHAMNLIHPAPLPASMEDDPQAAALWCMSMYGNRVHVATADRLADAPPDAPLRTDSLLHIAAARADAAAIDALLESGVPIDLPARDGLSPLHWSLAQDDRSIAQLLIDRGCPVDVRSAEQATPLMNCVQAGDLDAVTFLLDRGADPDAVDHRGFTSMHRAAELGHVEILTRLLERGADPAPEAEGHTPRSLAEHSGHAAVVALLDG